MDCEQRRDLASASIPRQAQLAGLQGTMEQRLQDAGMWVPLPSEVMRQAHGYCTKPSARLRCLREHAESHTDLLL